MWFYRTGQMYGDCPIVLYEYQKTRNASHPREFLKEFRGVCVTDGYQAAYHTIENEREDLKIAGCWAHTRRRFDEAVKALPKERRKESLAYLALSMIRAISREEKVLKEVSAEEREKRRKVSVPPIGGCLFCVAEKEYQPYPHKGKDLGRFLVLPEPGKIPESISGRWGSADA